MAGMLVEESVAALAMLELQIAPSPAPAMAVEIAKPPRTRPTQMVATLKRSSAIPLTTMNSAIRMNIGTETSS